MKHHILFIFYFISGMSFSQTISHSNIGGGYETFKSKNISLDLSIGENVTSTLSNDENVITQGFLQPTINYTIIFDKDKVCIGDTLLIKPSHGKNYNWINEDDEILSTDPTFKFQVVDSSSNIYLKINNSITISRPIILKDIKECPVNLLVYQLLTPNGDDKNNVLFIKNINKVPNHEVTILNRWGIEVFSSNSYKNDWSGEELSDGTYIYIVKDIEREITYTNKLIVKR